MKLPKVPNGNSFYIEYTLIMEDETPVLISDIQGLKAYIQYENSGKNYFPEYEYTNNTLTIHVLPEHTPKIGFYRVVLSGIYQGENIRRNPACVHIVEYSEESGLGMCEDANLQIIRLKIVDKLSVWNGGISDSVRWGNITGDINNQTDLKKELEKIKDLIPDLEGYATEEYVKNYVDSIVGIINEQLEDRLNGNT